MFHSCRNQAIYLYCKSVDWFLYEGNIGHKWMNHVICAENIFHIPSFVDGFKFRNTMPFLVFRLLLSLVQIEVEFVTNQENCDVQLSLVQIEVEFVTNQENCDVHNISQNFHLKVTVPMM